MSSTGERRPMRLAKDPFVGAPPSSLLPVMPLAPAAKAGSWRVRLEDGQVQGSFDFSQLEALTENGILNENAHITVADEDAWQPITSHPIWFQLSRPKESTVIISAGAKSWKAGPPAHLTPPRVPPKVTKPADWKQSAVKVCFFLILVLAMAIAYYAWKTFKSM